MPLLNYTTKVPAEKTAGEIMGLLARQGASEIMMVYDSGTVTGISWRINTPNGVLPFRLPVDEVAVDAVLTRQYHRGQVPRAAMRDGQPRRIAWRILKDWVEAQMALLETEMVTLDQIFLPYMLVGKDESLYQRLTHTDGFAMLTGPAIVEGRD